jgi:hypothetical protein
MRPIPNTAKKRKSLKDLNYAPRGRDSGLEWGVGFFVVVAFFHCGKIYMI